MVEALKSERIKIGSRTFFFDLLEAKDGSKYVKISESRRDEKEDKFKRQSIMVFSEGFEDFKKAFDKITQ
ncbi:MAG: DUF3276 family protein [Ignavibacteriales bacterium]|nr:DUF3276 family protein [Ignavibacteriales bacterium]